MASTLVGLIFVLLFVIMSTLGSVLIVAFAMSKSGFAKRVLAATLGGPGVMLAPLALVMLLDGDDDMFAALLGFSFIGAIACALIAWPVSHVATRRLDRMIQFDVGTFE